MIYIIILEFVLFQNYNLCNYVLMELKYFNNVTPLTKFVFISTRKSIQL